MSSIRPADNDSQLYKVEAYAGDCAALLCILEKSSDAGAGLVYQTWGFILILSNTASVTTGWLIPRGGNSTFFIAMVEHPSVYTKASGVFVSLVYVVNF